MRKREIARIIRIKEDQINALNFAIDVLKDCCISAFKQELSDLKRTFEKPADKKKAKNTTVKKTTKKKGK